MAKITNYDEMIKAADEIGNNLVTDNDIDDMVAALDDQSKDNPSVQDIRQAQKESQEFIENGNAGELSDGIAVIDPSTGKVKDILDPESTSFMDVSLEDIINDDSIITEPVDPSKVTIDAESIQTVVSDVYNMNVPLSPADIDMIIAAVDKYKNGEKFSYYNSLPQSIKDQINAMMSGDAALNMGTYVKQGRNYVAEQLLDFILRENTMNSEIIDLQNSIKQTISDTKDEINKSLSDMGNSQKKYYEETLPEIANKLKEDGKISQSELARSCSNSFTQAYTYEQFMEMYKRGKLKVKNIQLDKFNRTCMEFNMKYKDSKTSITDISNIVPVLDRHADKSFDLVVIREFVCAFINYTMNMKSTKLDDHVFMYFFITNILSLDYYDQNNEEDKKFHEDLLNTINESLSIIKDSRNNRGKKGGK